MNEKVLQELVGLDLEKEQAALATIIRTAGSTPRNVGAQMLVSLWQNQGTIRRLWRRK